MSETVAWFHCFSGIAGDMALGSLIDAGADIDEVRALLQRLAPARLGTAGRGRPAGRRVVHPGHRRRRTTT